MQKYFGIIVQLHHFIIVKSMFSNDGKKLYFQFFVTLSNKNQWEVMILCTIIGAILSNIEHFWTKAFKICGNFLNVCAVY
jgi:hypothetical protein